MHVLLLMILITGLLEMGRQQSTSMTLKVALQNNAINTNAVKMKLHTG